MAGVGVTRQGRRGQVQAATTAAIGLAYDFFRFLRRPLEDSGRLCGSERPGN